MAKNKHQILIIDDEELITNLLSEYFTNEGYDVEVAGSAEQAIEKLNNGHDFKLVLSDINLPGKSGIELLQIIRETRGDLPVVLLTGLKTVDNAISAVKSGATDYITKPFELEYVQRVVEKILKKQHRILRKGQLYEAMKYLKFSFEFETGVISPGILSTELASILRKMQFATEAEISQYELVFTEVLINAVEHGNLELSSEMKNNEGLKTSTFEELKEVRLSDPTYSKRRILVVFEASEEIFNLTVRDEGPGFDWKVYIDNSHRMKTDKIQTFGRGFQIIQHVIDEVHFNVIGNSISLIKNRPQPN